mmetsp:Transcript_27935/g.43591  ORF Transcript_27935/g.43591 Transcript_27935/m.43591 type:complete len:80 (+) Transcript_27935:953-1192(+)
MLSHALKRGLWQIYWAMDTQSGFWMWTCAGKVISGPQFTDLPVTTPSRSTNLSMCLILCITREKMKGTLVCITQNQLFL